MIKKLFAFTCLTLSIGANAAIVSLDSAFGADTITRDTDTGLDWLDVTVTRGLSYNQVDAQLGSGGDYDGYRYATMAEVDQLITNFGYIAVDQNCPYTSLHCDTGIAGDSAVIENIINTLGDTYDATLDATGALLDVSPTGAGLTYGILGTSNIDGVSYDVALIDDREFITRDTGAYFNDFDDRVVTASFATAPSAIDNNVGSFLVAPSPVPLPAAGWLFMSALIGLGVVKRKKA